MEFKNENDQVIQVDPKTVSSVKECTEDPEYSRLVIGTLEVMVAGAPIEVAAAIGAELGGAPVLVVPLPEPPADAGAGLPAGEPGEAPPPPESEAPPAKGKGKKNRSAWE